MDPQPHQNSDLPYQYYQQEGFVALPNLISPQLAAALSQAFEDYVGPDPDPLIYGIWKHNVWTEVDLFRQVIFEQKLGSLAAELMGIKEIILFQDTVIWKPPGSFERVQWHQDYSYWPVDKALGITIWIALEDSGLDNGCMSFIPGSHRWKECKPMIFTAEKASPGEGDLPPLLWKENEPNRIDYPCHQGDGAAMHPFNCHMSYANTSQKDRKGWVLSFVDPQVRWKPSHAVHPYNYLVDAPEGGEIEGDIFPRFQPSTSI